MRCEATGHYEVPSATGETVPSFVPAPLLSCSAGPSLNGLDGRDQATNRFSEGMLDAQVLSDGLARFRAVTTANCYHKAVITSGNHPNDLPQFRWINTLRGNLKASFCGTFHAFNYRFAGLRLFGSKADQSRQAQEHGGCNTHAHISFGA